MLELYWTKNENVHRKVEILIARHICGSFTILRSENGKPYVAGNPLFFSISHSRDRAVIALSDKPVGIDFEFYENRKFGHILSHFTQREKDWIGDCYALFFLNWIAKEAYIKLIGGTLAHDLKRLEFCDYKLYANGKEPSCGYANMMLSFSTGIIYAVCAEGYSAEQISETPMKLFKLKKGEKL